MIYAIIMDTVALLLFVYLVMHEHPWMALIPAVYALTTTYKGSKKTEHKGSKKTEQ